VYIPHHSAYTVHIHYILNLCIAETGWKGSDGVRQLFQVCAYSIQALLMDKLNTNPYLKFKKPEVTSFFHGERRVMF